MQLTRIVIVIAVSVLGSAARAEPARRLPLRRVAMELVADGEVVGAPTVMVGGTQCQRFVAGPAPALAVEYCATGDQLEVSWTVRGEHHIRARRVIGDFTPGATFDVSIPDVMAARVQVGPTEGYFEN